jgi:hypothetical protein
VRYHLTTPQGSTAVELDETGLLVSYEEYLPARRQRVHRRR